MYISPNEEHVKYEYWPYLNNFGSLFLLSRMLELLVSLPSRPVIVQFLLPDGNGRLELINQKMTSV